MFQNKTAYAWIVAMTVLTLSHQNCSNVGFRTSQSASQVTANDLDITPNDDDLIPSAPPPRSQPPPQNFDELAAIPILPGIVGVPTPSFEDDTGNGRCEPQNVVGQLKILYVVDESGSNVVHTKNNGTTSCNPDRDTCTLPTDPEKRFRNSALVSFFQAQRAKTNFSWALFGFESKVTKYATSFRKAASFESALVSFANEDDGGGTQYAVALNEASTFIRADLAQNPGHRYMVVFISDGFPSDGATSAKSAVSSLTKNIAASVVVSTVYYGQIRDARAIDLLREMAVLGGGQAIDAGAAAQLSVADLIPQRLCL